MVALCVPVSRCERYGCLRHTERVSGRETTLRPVLRAQHIALAAQPTPPCLMCGGRADECLAGRSRSAASDWWLQGGRKTILYTTVGG